MQFFKHSSFAILLLCSLAACSERPSLPPRHKKLKEILPAEVSQTVDSITGNIKTIRSNPGPMLTHLHHLAAKYPYSLDSSAHAAITLELGSLSSAIGRWDSGIHYMSEALPYLEARPYYTSQLIKCYTVLGTCIRNTGENNFKANYYCTKSAALSLLPGMDTVLNPANRIKALSAATESNTNCYQVEQAMHFGSAAYQLSFRYRDSFPDQCIRSAINLALLYTEKGHPDSVRYYVDLADQFCLKYHSEKYRDAILGTRGEYFALTRQYDSALRYELAKENSDQPLMESITKLNLYCRLRRGAEASREMRTAQAMVDSGLIEGHPEAFYLSKTMYNILYANRDSALASFLTFDSLSYDFYRQDRLKMFASIESEYNLADKQKNIDRLDEQNRNVAQELHQKNNLLIISVLSALLLGVAALALLLLSRQRKLRLAGQQAEAQRDKIELEQRLLRTQMEPHFIFNTLNAMQSMVRNNENEKAILYLSSFARLLRTSLEHSRENYVPLTDEVEALRDYLDLQALRFEQKFDYELDLYEGYENDDLTIPPMLLQPFVENAILHGIRSIEHKGLVSVVVEKGDGVLRCTITDNGKGIVPEETGKKKSLAIRIAQERLEIAGRETGHPGSIRVHNNAGAPGTSVELLIPYQA